jgi:uncharacterized protein
MIGAGAHLTAIEAASYFPAEDERLAVAVTEALRTQLDLDPRLERVMAAAWLRIDDDPGHDWSHILRCAEMALTIGEKVGADLSRLLPAAFFHDVVNVPKDDVRRAEASTHSAATASAVLVQLGYDGLEAQAIGTIIREHSCSLGAEPSSLESAVLQDADRLDAIGAVGIMRMVTCGVRLGTSYYDLADPFLAARQPNERSFMLDHLFDRLLRLGDRMNTDFAKAEAKERITFLRTFVDQLRKEVRPSTVRHVAMVDSLTAALVN